MDLVLALIPSPLTGPLVWAPVSRVLRRRGVATRVCLLEDGEGGGQPYWVRHAGSVARQLGDLTPEVGVVLVGHSGAGALLPAMGAFSPQPVAGYVFVDAGLPHPGQSRLAEIESGVPELAAELRELWRAGGRFPDWTDEDLRPLIPDDGLRQGVLAELRPRDEAFFSEVFPAFAGWPDAPCGYIRLSPGYEGAAQAARRSGWPCREFDAGHFHMLADPEAVAGAIVEITQRLGVPSTRVR